MLDTSPNTSPEPSPELMAPRPPMIRPRASFMLAHPAHLLALGFGSGLSRIVPGTVGTLFGWFSFHVLSARWPAVFTPQLWAMLIVVGFVIGVWACEKQAAHSACPTMGRWCGTKSSRSGW